MARRRPRLFVLLLLAAAPASAVRAGEETPPPDVPTTAVATIACGSGNIAPAPRFSSDGRWMILPEGTRQDEAVHGWTRVAFTLVDLAEGRVVLRVEDLTSGPNAPVFDRTSRWLAWGERRDPETLRVHRRALEAGETTAFDVPHRSGRGYAVLAAVSEDGRRVAVVEPERPRRRRSVIVHAAGGEQAVVRREDFAEPYFGASRFAVHLVGDLLLHHARPPDRGGGGDYRLEVFDLGTGSVRAALGAWVSSRTDRFALTAGARRLLNGDAAYDLQVVDLSTFEVRALGNVRKPLYSHWLEITPSPDGRRLAAWSDEREVVVVIDVADGARKDVPIPGRPGVLGFDPTGDRLCVVNGRGDLEVHDLEAMRVVARRAAPPHGVHLDPTGRLLVTATEAADGWHLQVERIEWEGLAD